MARAIKWILAIIFICGILYAAYRYLTREDEFEAFDDEDFDFDRVKIVRIKDTMHMTEIEVSETYLEEIRDNPEIEILSEPYEMDFSDDGFIVDHE